MVRPSRGGKEWSTLAQQDGTHTKLDRIDKLRFKQTPEELTPAGEPDVLSGSSTKLRQCRHTVVPENRDFRIVRGPKRPRENERPQSRITANPLAQHHFVRATPYENGIDRREERPGVVARVTNHPRGSIAAIGDEPVKTHADAVAYPPHCPSPRLPNTGASALVSPRARARRGTVVGHFAGMTLA